MFRCFTTVPMSQHAELNDMTAPPTNQRTFLVTLSARALGSLGLGLSILAIWLHWLVPSATAATPSPPDKQPQHRHKRRLSLPVPARPVPQVVPPMTGNRQSTGSFIPKRVYFEDSPPSQRNAPSAAEKRESLVLHSLPEENTASLSSSPTTSTPRTNSINSKGDDDSIVESDSSSRRSSLSVHLPKRINPFGAKPRQHAEPSPVMRTVSLQTEGKHGRRSSITFLPPWSPRRKATESDANIDPLPSSRPPTPLKSANLDYPSAYSTQTPMTSYFNIKPSRRVSSSVTRTRTQPYEAPYFALPPTGATPTFDLRKSPPMLQEALINSTRQNTSEDNRGRQAKHSRQGSVERTLPKRRSASEGWNTGRRALKAIDHRT